jgi:hypothetical protein
MDQRYQQLRYYLLRLGGFDPEDTKMSLIKIIEQMSPTLRCGLDPLLYQAVELIEDLLIELKEKENK